MKRVCSGTDDIYRCYDQAGRPEQSNPNVKIREVICKPANF